MYVPRHFEMPSVLLERVLCAPLAGDLITHGPDGLIATHLPYLHRRGVADGLGSLVLHVARNNVQWSQPTTSPALFVINLASDYISSLWYPSAVTDGKLVPTWDYATVHLYGELVAHDDADWTRAAVAELMARHEPRVGLADMPDRYVAAELRAIVGIELRITRIEAKAKLSQNRTPADVRGVIDGLHRAGAEPTARLVEEFALPHSQARAALVADVSERRRGSGRVIGRATND